jgi:hypothetical protein
MMAVDMDLCIVVVLHGAVVLVGMVIQEASLLWGSGKAQRCNDEDFWQDWFGLRLERGKMISLLERYRVEMSVRC